MVQQSLASWNVEGLRGDMSKLKEIIWHMREQSILIMCIQETHVCESNLLYESGYMVILSGSTDASAYPFYAGVGFIVALEAIPAVIG